MSILKINGAPVEAEQDSSLLEVLKANAVDIPTLCYHEGLPPRGSCRLCSVEIRKPHWPPNIRKLVVSCLYPVEDGLEVFTESKKVIALRHTLLELLLARAPQSQIIKDIAARHGVNTSRFTKYDPAEQCVLCGQCVRACHELGTAAISMINRGIEKRVTTPYDEASDECIGCGACAQVCPVNAIRFEQKDNIRKVRDQTFELQKCSSCGKPFITRAQVHFMKEKFGIPLEYFDKCPGCKSHQTAENFKEVMDTLRR